MTISIKSITTGIDVWPTTTVDVTTSETPSATQVGDLVVVINCGHWDTLAAMQTPTATGSPTLTAITGGSVDSGTDFAHIKSYTYVVNTGGAQTIAAAYTGDGFSDKLLAVYVLAGADTSTPVDVAGGSFDATTVDPWVLASISPSTSDAFLIAHVNRGGAGGTDGTASVPGGMTEHYNFATDPNTGPDGMGATQQLSASGATGTRTFDPGIAARPFAGVMIAVRTVTVKYAMLRPAVVTR